MREYKLSHDGYYGVSVNAMHTNVLLQMSIRQDMCRVILTATEVDQLINLLTEAREKILTFT